MDRGINLIGFPENILRYCAAGILLEEGEVSKELVHELIHGDGSLAILQATDDRVRYALRKAASVIMTLRANDMLKEKGQ